MKVYKYRSGKLMLNKNEDLFERDLKSIEKNIFWASKYENLNDPCEGLIIKNENKDLANLFEIFYKKKGLGKLIENVSNAVGNLYDVFKDGLGIYSLSKTYKDELLWAHYANSHHGFCIEYDLDLLLNNYYGYDAWHFPVDYTDVPPQYSIGDSNLSKKNKITKLAGFKSKAWSNEEEYRIVTELSGEYPYNHDALTGIYFGLRMSIKDRETIIERLKGRGIKYYEIVQSPNSYKFKRSLVLDDSSKKTYLKEIPSKITQGKNKSYHILSKKYSRVHGIAWVDINIESDITKDELKWLSKFIKNNLFSFAKELKIFIQKKEQKKYAYSVTNNDTCEITIYELTNSYQ